MVCYTLHFYLGNQREPTDYAVDIIDASCLFVNTLGIRSKAGIPTTRCKIFSIIPASKVPAPKDTNPYTIKKTTPVIRQIFVARLVAFSRTFKTTTAPDKKNKVAKKEAIVNN